MKDYELAKIDRLIKKELDKDILLRIKKMVENQINVYESIKSEVLTDRQMEVLLENLSDYYKSMRTSDNRLPILPFQWGMIEYFPDIYYTDLRVYHLIKVGGTNLLKTRNIGPKTVEIIETKLNEDNLSLYKPIIDEELDRKMKKLTRKLD